MRDEGAHPEFPGEGERVTVVALSVLREITAGTDLAQELEGSRLGAALTALAGERQASAREF